MAQKQDDRDKRLAEALRANLRKRKMRANEETAPTAAPDNPGQQGSS